MLGAAKPSATAARTIASVWSSSWPSRRKQTTASVAGETTSQPPRRSSSASAYSASAIVVRDRGLEGVEAEDAQREPQLQRAGAAGELRAALAQLDHAGVAVAQVGAVERERVLQQARVADQHGADLVGLEEPLVRVQHEAVGALDAGQQVLAARREAGGRAVGAVDVEPQALALRRASARSCERIDAAGARRPGGADEQERPQAGLAVERGSPPRSGTAAAGRRGRPSGRAGWRG